MNSEGKKNEMLTWVIVVTVLEIEMEAEELVEVEEEPSLRRSRRCWRCRSFS